MKGIEMTQQQAVQNSTSIDPATQVGVVTISVSDLDRSIDFYTNVLGFKVLKRSGDTAVLGAGGTPLLTLKELSGADSSPARATGLYHFAILFPTRRDLGRALRHLLQAGHPMPGQGDHAVSEALYLSDPDGNGIELYRDRPRDAWKWSDGTVYMTTGPVDIRGLLADAEADDEPWTGYPQGTRMGHIHLQVADIDQAERFYHDILGFDIVAKMPSAIFLSAGGYHHHIGANTWNSLGASARPKGATGLEFFVLELPSDNARQAVIKRLDDAGIRHEQVGGDLVVHDPWQNRVVLHVGAIPAAEQAESLAGAV
jgi:catechol 2,3-dioxygenase